MQQIKKFKLCGICAQYLHRSSFGQHLGLIIIPLKLIIKNGVKLVS